MRSGSNKLELNTLRLNAISLSGRFDSQVQPSPIPDGVLADSEGYFILDSEGYFIKPKD